MCGIYGTTINYSSQQVKEKLERTNFRGPDRSKHGYSGNDNKVILGHNRLSIIDLDPRSDQPFVYENLSIVFNGEIYNFKDLKSKLISQGFSFRTESDTEVICALYLKYGTKCVDHLNGMFAFVIHDSKNNMLFGTRDRLGQKPLYIYRNGMDIEFASQISSIQLHHTNLSISKKAIGYYLAWGNIPDPLSIFNEVRKLKPGYSFIFKLSDGVYKEEQYWDINLKEKNTFSGTFEQAKVQLEEILSDSVNMRLFADVPVGVFLSGGIDSSLISAIASKVSSSRVKTFSVKFNEDSYDESLYAKKVAKHLGTEHHEILCDFNEGLNLIENFSTYYDEPFADSSAIPTMLLSKYTRQNVTVALSGDAGDEIFLGYARYQASLMKKIFSVPHSLRKMMATGLSLVPNYKLGVIAKGLKIKNIESFYLNSFISIDRDWVDNNIDPLDIDEKKYIYSGNGDIYERMAQFDLKTYLNWDINTKVDRASMAFSLESRSPLMDYRVVEFANTLPREYKMQGTDQKRILKSILYDHVPKSFFDRPKSGFTMPFADWFRGSLKDYVMDELSTENLNEIPYINTQKVKFRIDQHMKNEWNRTPIIWKILVLRQWLSHNAKYSIV